MGVNMAGNCIIDDEVCQEASRQEIIRRYYKGMDALIAGTGTEEEVYKIELLLKQAHAALEDRKVVPASLELEKAAGAPAAAMELDDGRVITGKTSDLLGASSALLLNVLKELAGIDHAVHVISPDAIHPIQELKTNYLGSKNPRLHMDERPFHQRSYQPGCPPCPRADSEAERLPGTYLRYAFLRGYPLLPQAWHRTHLRTEIRAGEETAVRQSRWLSVI